MAVLILKDGRKFDGVAFGAQGTRIGQVVFYTGMSGYLETMTDPAAAGQLVAFTYPLIGNYGINPDDIASTSRAGGIIVREATKEPSNYRAQQRLAEFLADNDIVGIEGIDTRALTRHIRMHGSQLGVISSQDITPAQAAKLLDSHTVDTTLPADLSQVRTWGQGATSVVLLNLGVTDWLIQRLLLPDIRLTVVPFDAPMSTIDSLAPHALVVAGGYQHLATNPTLQSTLGALASIPTMAIGSGCLAAAVSVGYSITALPYGHHGQQPITDIANNVIFESDQYHESAPSGEVRDCRITHRNVHDKSIEGFATHSHKLHAMMFVADQQYLRQMLAQKLR